jgi:hypothetical protein
MASPKKIFRTLSSSSLSKWKASKVWLQMKSRQNIIGSRKHLGCKINTFRQSRASNMTLSNSRPRCRRKTSQCTANSSHRSSLYLMASLREARERWNLKLFRLRNRCMKGLSMSKILYTSNTLRRTNSVTTTLSLVSMTWSNSMGRTKVTLALMKIWSKSTSLRSWRAMSRTWALLKEPLARSQ